MKKQISQPHERMQPRRVNTQYLQLPYFSKPRFAFLIDFNVYAEIFDFFFFLLYIYIFAFHGER